MKSLDFLDHPKNVLFLPSQKSLQAKTVVSLLWFDRIKA